MTGLRQAEPSRDHALVETKVRILDAAEILFAQDGFEKVSIRDITLAAGTNLAAINYHFGSKDGLITAIFERRLTPVNGARLAALDAVEKAAGANPPKLEDVLEALIRPVVEFFLDPQWGSISFSRLMGRCISEPGELLEKLMQKHFETLVFRFHTALMRAAPTLSREDVFWRMHFTVTTLHQALLAMEKPLPNWLTVLLDGKESPRDAESLVQRLMAFAAAGWRAAPSKKP